MKHNNKRGKSIFFLAIALCLFLSGCGSQDAQSQITSTPSESETTENQAISDVQKSPEQTESDSLVGNAIPFSAVPSETETDPLNAESTLPVLELPNELGLPSLHAWKLQKGEPELLTASAEQAASVLWNSYIREEYDWGVRLSSPVTQTAEGDYQEHVSVTAYGELRFQAGWLETEETPFFDAAPVEEEQAVTLARSLAAVFGLEAETQAEPLVTLDQDGAEYIFSWPCYIEGLLLEYEHGLTIRVIGDKAVSLKFSTGAINQIAENAPAYFLEPEQAMYCINYARSLAQADSVMYEMPVLERVELLWTTMFAHPDYTPAYAFYFTNQRDTLSGTFYVDVFTGEVATGTNEGNYPSPYHF